LNKSVEEEVEKEIKGKGGEIWEIVKKEQEFYKNWSSSRQRKQQFIIHSKCILIPS
jgi:hypothetical protein